jgi:hypothetical protein
MTVFFRLRCYGLGVCISLIMFGGCGGAAQMPQPSSGIAQTVPPGRQNVDHTLALTTRLGFGAPQVNRGNSWMSSQWRNELLNPHHKKRVLLYVGVGVSYYANAIVEVLDFKTGAKIGQVSGFSDPEALCSDRKGNVYVGDTYYGGFEIQAGTTRVINSWPNTGGEPDGCAVSSSGDVAFTNWKSNPEGGGDVEVFPGGGHTGIIHYGPGTYDEPAAYDNKGNLCETCFGGPSSCNSGKPELWEIPAGGNSWMPLSSNRSLGWAPLEWDGKFLAILCGVSINEHRTCIDQVAVSGSTAKRVNQVRFSARSGRGRHLIITTTWAEDAKEPNGQTTSPATQIAASGGSNILVWSYPAGGKPKRTIITDQYVHSVTIVKV